MKRRYRNGTRVLSVSTHGSFQQFRRLFCSHQPHHTWLYYTTRLCANVCSCRDAHALPGSCPQQRGAALGSSTSSWVRWIICWPPSCGLLLAWQSRPPLAAFSSRLPSSCYWCLSASGRLGGPIRMLRLKLFTFKSYSNAGYSAVPRFPPCFGCT